MYDPLQNFGDWWAESFINGATTGEKKFPPDQFYPPHGRVHPTLGQNPAKPGSIFSVDVRHVDPFGVEHLSVPNACIVP